MKPELDSRLKRQLTTKAEKYLKKKLHRLPPGSMAGKSLTQWVEETLQGNPTFAGKVTAKFEETKEGKHILSLTLT